MAGKKRPCGTVKEENDPPKKQRRLSRHSSQDKTGKQQESCHTAKQSTSQDTIKVKTGLRSQNNDDHKKLETQPKPKSLQRKTPQIKTETKTKTIQRKPSYSKVEIKTESRLSNEEKSKYFSAKRTSNGNGQNTASRSLENKTGNKKTRSNSKESAVKRCKQFGGKSESGFHTEPTVSKTPVAKKQSKGAKVKVVSTNKNTCHDEGATETLSNGKPRVTEMKPKSERNPKTSVVKSKMEYKEAKLKSSQRIPTAKIEIPEESDSTDSDWEEVEDLPGPSPERDQIPKEPVVITLEAPTVLGHKKKKGKFDLVTYLKRQLNRNDKEVQENMHKVHLLCLLSHGFHRNRVCNNRTLQAIGLSLVPCEMTETLPVFWDTAFLKKFVCWFKSTFQIKADLRERNETLIKTMVGRFATQSAATEAELVFMCVIMLRSLGAEVRLVYSLNSVSHKPSAKVTTLPEKWRKILEQQGFQVPAEFDKMISTEVHLKTEESSKSTENTDAVGKAKGGSSPEKGKDSKQDVPQGSKCPKVNSTPQPKNSKRRTCASKVTRTDPEVVNLSDDSDCKVIEIASESDFSEEERGRKTKKPLSSRKTSSSRGAQKSRESKKESRSCDDSDFESEEIVFRKSPSLRKKSSKGKGKGDSNKNIVSSDSDDVQITKVVEKHTGADYWLEVYVERIERWICVDCVNGRVNHPSTMEQRASQPVIYVIGYDNWYGIKDVTQRYASGWMSQTRRLRIDEPWWEDVLAPYKPRNKTRNETESLSFQAQQMRKPLPTSIGEYKSHPLYALKRHLLKFEAIYPESSVPVGYIKGEPVYSRDCVHELHTRQAWVREGRAVRVKEKLYKLVKARKKRNAKSFESDSEEKMAEVFGRWQTEQYMPPPAYNGKVPRNEYGNVEVFKPWMIPNGAVHLPIPGLNKVARKLNIDCAPAMTGWDFHGGFNHPILDGFIVCEEFKDVLLAAWDEQQEIDQEKEKEKREKRALANWKLFTKSLLIKERLKKRFDLHEKPVPPSGGDGSGCQVTEEQKACDVAQSWPLNRETENAAVKGMSHKSLFPSEEL